MTKLISITVKVPVSVNTLVTHCSNAHRTLELLQESELVNAWRYASAANYMLRYSLIASGTTNGNKHVLSQYGSRDVLVRLQNEMIRRGLHLTHCLTIERKKLHSSANNP